MDFVVAYSLYTENTNINGLCCCIFHLYRKYLLFKSSNFFTTILLRIKTSMEIQQLHIIYKKMHPFHILTNHDIFSHVLLRIALLWIQHFVHLQRLITCHTNLLDSIYLFNWIDLIISVTSKYWILVEFFHDDFFFPLFLLRLIVISFLFWEECLQRYNATYCSDQKIGSFSG
jgi:hypothetical protein